MILDKTYYRYDIDLDKYTTTLNIGAGNSSMRKFRISTWLVSGYVDLYQYSMEYSITMCNELYNGTGDARAGLKISAFGGPFISYNLDKVAPSGQFLIKNTFKYLTYCSLVPNTKINCIIEDIFN